MQNGGESGLKLILKYKNNSQNKESRKQMNK